MEQLLPYYERELGLFRQYTREFSSRFPKAAGRLLIAGDTCEDPHIERLIQSFALLTARVAKRLDDDYPQFTDSLLETLYPHYLRPFPSCSIARIAQEETPAGSQLTTVARGTVLRSHPVQGVACKFSSAYEVTLAPLTIAKLRFHAIIAPPPGLRLPDGASALLSITFASSNDSYQLEQTGLRHLRVFADGEPSVRAALLDALFLRNAGAYIALDEHSPWLSVAGMPLSPAGYADTDALIPFDARSHPALGLLTEYFAFPEKFHFFDIDWPMLGALLPAQCRQFTLHLPLSHLRSDSHAARLLASVSRDNLLLGCTPVVNLFSKAGVPLRLTHTEADHALIADATHASAYDIHSIESVTMVRKDEAGEHLTTFLPLYSSLPGEPPASGGHYWLARRRLAGRRRARRHTGAFPAQAFGQPALRCGRRCALAARLRICPLTAQQHATFLPGAPNSVQLKNMLILFGQPLLRYDIVLVLRASEVRGLTLCATGESRLGDDSFLGQHTTAQPRDDMHHVMHLICSIYRIQKETNKN
ncbi:type VI secretion system baseplate subunit TssF [Janthinobacterium sp. Mn2066]|uniref:type VI secretion system baseplate subunit TssF n=1 Tax=Janthinobacterium sp. Mn2066 TaxID=3395264 RepID=UPI003BBBD1BB